MSRYDYDLFTIGAGSGGVRASRVAASLGDTDPVVQTLAVQCLLSCSRKDVIEDGLRLAAETPPVDVYRNGDFHLTSIEELLG